MKEITKKITGWLTSHKSKIIKTIAIGIVVVVAISIAGAYIFNIYQIKQDRENYIGTFKRYSKMLENANDCQQKLVDLRKDKLIGECQDKYDKAYLSYQNCRKDFSWW